MMCYIFKRWCALCTTTKLIWAVTGLQFLNRLKVTPSDSVKPKNCKNKRKPVRLLTRPSWVRPASQRYYQRDLHIWIFFPSLLCAIFILRLRIFQLFNIRAGTRNQLLRHLDVTLKYTGLSSSTAAEQVRSVCSSYLKNVRRYIRDINIIIFIVWLLVF